MKSLYYNIPFRLYLILLLCIYHGQSVFSQEQHELTRPLTPHMEDSLTLPQVFLKNHSLLVVIDSISRVQWEKTGKHPQDYILQLFMIRDNLIVYTSWIQIEWLVDAIFSRSNLITKEYFTGQLGKIVGFVGYNNCNFYIIDMGIPADIRNNIYEVNKNFRLTFRIQEPIKEWNGMTIYDINVHRGIATYMMLNGQFIRCSITRKKKGDIRFEEGFQVPN